MSDINKHGDGDPRIAEFELCHNPEEVLRIGRDFQRQDTFRGAQHDTVKLLCDTIEYLRDRLSKQVGNAAAMREALEHIGIIAEAMYSDSGDCNSVNANTVSILNLVRAALAAPARNCDFYDNKTDAETGFVEETGENDTSQHYWQMFAIWLFALAAELKGSNR